MRFQAKIIRNAEGRRTKVYVPRPVESDFEKLFIESTTTVNFEKNTRQIPSRLISMMLAFGTDYSEKIRRERLGHDCLAFALACEADDPLTHADLSPSSGRRVNIARVMMLNNPNKLVPIIDPELEPGKIAITSNALPKTSGFNDARIPTKHFLVRATEGPDEPLWLSKFGQRGSVALHTLASSLDYYPAAYVGQASDLSLANH